MKKVFRKCVNWLLYIIMYPILTVLDIVDSFFASRKYKQLFQLTDELYNDYCDTKKLFFLDGGYEANKNLIKSRAKVLKQDAEWIGKMVELLNKDWGEYFNDSAKEILQEEIALMKEIQEFGNDNCQEEST